MPDLETPALRRAKPPGPGKNLSNRRFCKQLLGLTSTTLKLPSAIAPDEYVGLAQSYELFDSPEMDGAEAFSLIRHSVLDPDDYLNAFFDTGDEHQPRSPTTEVDRSTLTE